MKETWAWLPRKKGGAVCNSEPNKLLPPLTFSIPCAFLTEAHGGPSLDSHGSEALMDGMARSGQCMMDPLPCNTLDYPENIEKIKFTCLGSNPRRVHQRPTTSPSALACLVVPITKKIKYNANKMPCFSKHARIQTSHSHTATTLSSSCLPSF